MPEYVGEPRAVRSIHDPTQCTLRMGDSYAFRLDGREFFAVAKELDGFTGFLVLETITRDEHFARIAAQREP